ncbi:hypothetical protein L1281_000927 [Neisseria sp. HSC-16F19]|nr:DUF4126 domain-containing protein [Neisseria sp. HSC-16F19]MCP2040345.1 hypothetical protein [Neisseria sp. HSC-16F19]
MDFINFDTLTSIALGIGLAACSGFRVFLPLFFLSLSASLGFFSLNEGWQWLAHPSTVLLLGAATCAEVGAYFFPWLDNVLDTLAIPLAALAGTLIMVSTVGDMHPAAGWSLAVIAGGGTAGGIKTGIGGTRLLSTSTTGGLANPIIAFIETVLAVIGTLLTLLMPVLMLTAIIFTIIWLWRRRARRLAAQSSA